MSNSLWSVKITHPMGVLISISVKCTSRLIPKQIRSLKRYFSDKLHQSSVWPRKCIVMYYSDVICHAVIAVDLIYQWRQAVQRYDTEFEVMVVTQHTHQKPGCASIVMTVGSLCNAIVMYYSDVTCPHSHCSWFNISREGSSPMVCRKKWYRVWGHGCHTTYKMSPKARLRLGCGDSRESVALQPWPEARYQLLF